MIKLKIAAISALMLTFVAGLSAPAYADPDILVTPLYYDFGKVEVGDSPVTTITIDNFNGHPLVITEISMADGSSADIFIASDQQFPIVLDSDDLLFVDVVFSPTSEDPSTAGMGIFSNDPDESLVVVEFAGVGIAAPGAPITIEDILSFFDVSVDEGTIEGQGRRWVAKWQLNRFRGMILIAGIFIDNGYNRMACWQLEIAEKYCDGIRMPPDLIVGEAVAELNAMILQLMADMGCE